MRVPLSWRCLSKFTIERYRSCQTVLSDSPRFPSPHYNRTPGLVPAPAAGAFSRAGRLRAGILEPRSVAHGGGKAQNDRCGPATPKRWERLGHLRLIARPDICQFRVDCTISIVGFSLRQALALSCGAGASSFQ
jgi:hypothetical protein